MDLRRSQRIVLFGGSFDPPHVAHLALPEMTREALRADVVAYIPAGRAPHKQRQRQTEPHHRLAMLRLAVAAQTNAVVLTDEIDRAATGEPSYTVDTLRALRRRLGEGVELRLLIGADMLRIFADWREPAAIVELAEPVVMVRPPDTRDALLASLPAADRDAWAKRLVDLPQMAISSTDIRDRLAAGGSVAGLVPPAVLDYIRRTRLYV